MPVRRASFNSGCGTFSDFMLPANPPGFRHGSGRVSSRVVATLAILCCIAAGLPVDAAVVEDRWEHVETHASGHTVYFNAWGGDVAINRYIRWAGERIRDEYGVRLVHVKVTDIAEAVSRIMAERAAGRDRNGSVDLLWINGENFAALKSAGLLWGPWTERLPNAHLVDWLGNPTTRVDVTVPTEGYELPWGTSVFTLFYDRTSVVEPPAEPAALLQWIHANPGRFSYPQPPSFLGTAFLKQMLLVLTTEPERLQSPVGADFPELTAPLWSWLDSAHADMWRSGRLFPRSGPAQRELLAVGELAWMMSYNPAEASRAIRQSELPATISPLHLGRGALANSHFLAIPYNASAKAGALVTANFLISPEAQAHKASVDVWGDPTVLDAESLDPDSRAQFEHLGEDASIPAPPGRLLPEPHPSWTTRLEQVWLERYVR